MHPNYKELNLLAQQQAKRSHYKVYTALVALRKLPVLRHGRFNIETLSRAVFAIKRYKYLSLSISAIINPFTFSLSLQLPQGLRHTADCYQC